MSENTFLANILRHSLLKSAEAEKTAKVDEKPEQFEYISKTEKNYVSPIMSMSEDEMVAFVEEFDVNELATLSDEELNKMQEVLGADFASGEGEN